jgi:acyl-CoA synthetase (AMP-forming)/AMP-acid ligase II
MSFWLFERMKQAGGRLAVAHDAAASSYRDVLERVTWWQDALHRQGVTGRVLSIEGDYGVESIAVLLAAMSARNTVVPISTDSQAHLDEFLDVADVEYRVSPDRDRPVIQATGRTATHNHYRTLQNKGAAGLVLFSSGSTGKHKAAVHNLDRLLEKFVTPRHCYRTLVFLQLDHIGGLNTLFYTLANGGTVVVSRGRMPRQVCEAIARHRVELLPTSPTFLNMLLLSEEHLRHDLSSLQLITYGTEPMPEATLRRTHDAFPYVRLLQTYGLSELGILRSQSRAPGSLWVRVGGEGYETKVVDGRLWIRARTAMLGYLNAPNPFDTDGFFDTGDLVECDGEWLRILGRRSEVINVGGNKVFPTEVENTLLGLENVEDVVVRGESNPFTGQAVVAAVRLARPEPAAEFKTRMRLYCRDRLPAYKIPVRVQFADTLHSERFKKVRHA